MIAELKARLRLPTPAFWKKVQRRSAAASVAFTGLTTTLASLSDHLPSKLGFLTTAAGFGAAFFGGIAAVSMLAVDDASQLPDPATEPVPPTNEPTT